MQCSTLPRIKVFVNNSIKKANLTDVKAFELGKSLSYGQQNGDYKPRLKESVDVILKNQDLCM